MYRLTHRHVISGRSIRILVVSFVESITQPLIQLCYCLLKCFWKIVVVVFPCLPYPYKRRHAIYFIVDDFSQVLKFIQYTIQCTSYKFDKFISAEGSLPCITCTQDLIFCKFVSRLGIIQFTTLGSSTCFLFEHAKGEWLFANCWRLYIKLNVRYLYSE